MFLVSQSIRNSGCVGKHICIYTYIETEVVRHAHAGESFFLGVKIVNSLLWSFLLFVFQNASILHINFIILKSKTATLKVSSRVAIPPGWFVRLSQALWSH